MHNLVSLMETMDISGEDLLRMSSEEAKKLLSVPEMIALHKLKQQIESSRGKLVRLRSSSTILSHQEESSRALCDDNGFEQLDGFCASQEVLEFVQNTEAIYQPPVNETISFSTQIQRQHAREVS